MYDLRAIANYFISRGLGEKVGISPMKLQKLLFFACGIYMAESEDEGKRLFSDRFEAWVYGPVISDLYHSLKGYGSNPIDRHIATIDVPGLNITTPMIDERETDLLKFLDRIWGRFRGWSAYQLSAATHMEGTPWFLARAAGQDVIDDEEIRKHFTTHAY